MIPSGRRVWRGLQWAMLVVGFGILLALVFLPDLGLHLLWDVLIPAAPLLLVLVPGFWRNVCPMSSMAMMAHRFGVSSGRIIDHKVRPWLSLGGVVLLFTMVPLRHAVLDLNGPASAAFLAGVALIAMLLGKRFAWKSAWCSGICPVRQVETLYGFSPAKRFVNAHCGSCGNCSNPCPESTKETVLCEPYGSAPNNLARVLMLGGFPGFVWGWFHVPDYSGAEGWSHLGTIYGMPLAGAAVTLAMFLFLERFLPQSRQRILRRGFPAAAVSCYYWYRLPALLGFGILPGDGMLIDLSSSIPSWIPMVLTCMTTGFLAWWMVLRPGRGLAWMHRPPLVSTNRGISV